MPQDFDLKIALCISIDPLQDKIFAEKMRKILMMFDVEKKEMVSKISGDITFKLYLSEIQDLASEYIFHHSISNIFIALCFPEK